MASPLNLVAYQEHFFNPISFQYAIGDVVYRFMFCVCATDLVKVKTCDGEQRTKENNCGHFDR